MWEGIAFAVATIAGKEARRKKLAGIDTTVDKSKFNRTSFPFDKYSRRDEQFKFFGYKPKRFISVYAKKPRIVYRAKVKQSASSAAMQAGICAARQSQAYAALYKNQLNRGMQGSVFGFNQMAVAQQVLQLGLHTNRLIGRG